KVIGGKLIDVAKYIELYETDETKLDTITLLKSSAITKTMLVEVYKPAIDIDSSEKTVELRAENQLKEGDKTHASTTIKLNVLASGDDLATYHRVFIDKGRDYAADDVEYTYKNGDLEYRAILDESELTLTITVVSIPENYDEDFIETITLFVADFHIYLDSPSYLISEISKKYTVIAYAINVKIIKTEKINDINVTSLKLVDDEGFEEVIVEGVTVTTKVKTYEEIYLETSEVESNTTNVYKILTQILPLDAFDKELKYTFVPDLNTAIGLVDVSNNDGMVYYSGFNGGSGKIVITPADQTNLSIKVVIPIVIADGNTKTTAFRIGSLNEIVNAYKHYKIIANGTLTLSETLLGGEVFHGGLYGEGVTIQLNKCNLFNELSATAVVEDLYIYGNAKGDGFVANKSAGLINNVSITTYILGGKYIPSLLIPTENSTAVGGIVGINDANGNIKNCTFAGSIDNTKGIVADPICGINFGTIGSAKIIISRYDLLEQNKDRVFKCQDTENVSYYDYYVNGIITGNLTGEMFGENTGDIVKPEFLNGDEKVNSVEGKSICGDNASYAVVFYYKAKDASKQQELNEYNEILISELISNDSAKVVAYNKDNTICNFVEINPTSLIIKGTGEFTLRIFSEYDYTDANIVEINVLSIYYMSDFGIYSDGEKYQDESDIKIVKGGRKQIYSNVLTVVDDIELVANDLTLVFNILNKTANNEDYYASDYITGTKLGYHTINAIWGEDDLNLSVGFTTGYGKEFDLILNNHFCNGYNVALKISLGTTRVETSASDGVIEPKDSATFNAIITTDMVNNDGTTEDFIDTTTLTIVNDENYTFSKEEMLEVFDIYVSSA
ncbi:MAG: hypothetical protein IJW25_01675, partial [Clostridia bacterium]|nr:hypothetical protein [Clostridia bacterium]